MKLEPEELESIAEAVADRLIPRIVAELRQVLNKEKDERPLLSRSEAAELMGVSTEWLRQRAAAGEIEERRAGGRVWYAREDLMAMGTCRTPADD